MSQVHVRLAVTRRSSGRRAILLLALVLSLLLAPQMAVVGASPAQAQTSGLDPVEPADLDDPVALALSWSALVPDGAADTVLLGTTRSFADSLAAGGVQNHPDGGPLLLHDDGPVLDQRVADEIERLGADRVIILGGTVAISGEVESALAADHDVERLFGDGRRQTAIAIAERFFPDAGEAIIVRADGDAEVPTRGFIDAIGAGTLSKALGLPILLNSTDQLDDVVRDYLTTNQIREFRIVGGTGAISDEVSRGLREIGMFPRRAGGQSRAETAALVALDVSLASTSTAEVPIILDGNADLAWAEGLPATYHGEILLLTDGDDAPSPSVRNVITDFPREPQLRCASLTSETACAEMRAAEAVALGDDIATLDSTLDTHQEVPPADTIANAEALLFLGEGFTCVRAVATSLSGPPTGFHLHEAPRGQNGDVVIGFPTDEYLGEITRCETAVDDGVLSRAKADPSGFYLNVHTAAAPAGEVRGQTYLLADDLFASPSGEEVVPAGSGHPSGGAIVRIERAEDGIACYRVSPAFGADVTSATVHEAAPGADGPVVIDLQMPTTDRLYRRCLEVASTLLDRLFETPESFYVQLATTDFPEGAHRGQLR